MKIRKTANQQNFCINKEYYTVRELKEMARNHEIFFFKDILDECYDVTDMFDYEIERTQFRVFAENLKEVKVVVDEYGYYTTVAVGKNDKTYFAS